MEEAPGGGVEGLPPNVIHFYLPQHEVGVTDNVFRLVTVRGIVPVSGICPSVCTSWQPCHTSHYFVRKLFHGQHLSLI